MERAIHPAAEIFPLLPETELAALAADIAEHGQREPITVDRSGAILDGRNRYLACERAGVEPRFRTWEGEEGEALAFVLSLNLHRRHLNESQRALVGKRVETLKHGQRADMPIGMSAAVTRGEAAAMLNVSPRSIARAGEVLENGTPELIAAVENGQVAVSVASELAQAGPEVQRELLATLRGKALSKAARAVGRQARARKKPAPDLELASPPAELPVASGTRNAPEFVTVDEWKGLGPDEQRAVLVLRDTGRTFNRQSTTSIEWAQWSWNPVTGCRHDCPYCYARDFAHEHYPKALGFEPAIHPGRFGMPQATKVPAAAAEDLAFRNVFTCSMADLFGRWVPAEWIRAVLGVVAANRQWNFLLLTKFPKRYCEFEFSPNAWLGTTVDCQARVRNAEEAFSRVAGGTKWLSVEPLLEPLKFSRLDLFDWVVVGGATPSTQTPEWVPPIDWVVDLHAQARAAGCRIYYKDNCGMLDSLRIREFPWVDPGKKELPKAFHYLQGLG
jgi:protein gp37/ParB-like chromosome segregation protein Spo0J